MYIFCCERRQSLVRCHHHEIIIIVSNWTLLRQSWISGRGELENSRHIKRKKKRKNGLVTDDNNELDWQRFECDHRRGQTQQNLIGSRRLHFRLIIIIRVSHFSSTFDFPFLFISISVCRIYNLSLANCLLIWFLRWDVELITMTTMRWAVCCCWEPSSLKKWRKLQPRRPLR